jgi:hypothetical protein
MTEFPFWRKSLLEALETMTVDDLAVILDAWNDAKPAERPARRELWFRGKRWRKSMDFVERALGRDGNVVEMSSRRAKWLSGATR